MITTFNVGDNVLIKGKVETIYVDTDTTGGKPFYKVNIKGAAPNDRYSIQVSEKVMKVMVEDEQQE